MVPIKGEKLWLEVWGSGRRFWNFLGEVGSPFERPFTWPFDEEEGPREKEEGEEDRPSRGSDMRRERAARWTGELWGRVIDVR